MNFYQLFMFIRLTLLSVTGCLLLTACEPSGSGRNDTVSSIILQYEEQEAGTDSYPVRVLVNPGYVRFDDGNDTGDYLLLDRATRHAFSVVHEERSILVLDVPDMNTRMPENISIEERRDIDEQAPAVGGARPVHVKYMADGEVCLQAIVVPGFLPEAAGALAEYARLLGDRQLNNMQSVPAEMQTGCFMTRYVYLPGRHLEDGLPLQEWDANGYRRSLIEFREDMPVSASLFSLPVDYEEIRMGGSR